MSNVSVLFSCSGIHVVAVLMVVEPYSTIVNIPYPSVRSSDNAQLGNQVPHRAFAVVVDINYVGTCDVWRKLFLFN